MDKETRLALLILVVAIAVWRFARYMRFGLSRTRRATGLGVAGGLIPQDSDRPAETHGLSAPAQGSLSARIVEVLVTIGLWLAINALLWYCLFELPPLKNLPPVPVGVAGIFANFYIIPLARRLGARSRRRLEEARAGTASWPPHLEVDEHTVGSSGRHAGEERVLSTVVKQRRPGRISSSP